MKIIKTQSNHTSITLSQKEWYQIGFTSGWLNKQAEDMDLTRQKADTDKLFKALSEMRANLGGLQNNNDPQKSEAINLRIDEILNDISENNWVAKLDSEIGLDIDNLQAAADSNNLDAFNRVLESYFKPNLEESKAQLDRQLQKQKGGAGAQGVGVGLEQAVEDTGDSYA